MDELRIQIVNYKTKKYLLRCLETVFADLKDSSITFSIAVLDNASGDDLSDIQEKFSDHSIEIFNNSNNGGFGAGHNILAKAGNAKYLLLLNPDIEIIEPRTIKRLLERAKTSKAEVVGPQLVTTEKHTPQHYDHGELYGFRAWVAQNAGHAFWQERKNVTRVAWVSGAVFLIEKDWFDRLGGFDEEFFLYMEELDLCLRIREIGGIVMYDPTITIFHHGSVVAKKSEHQQASSAYFIQKHFRHRIDYKILQWINGMVN